MMCFIFSLLIALNAHCHPVHVSVLNIEYSSGKSTIDLSFKLFTSDVELALAHNYNVALNLENFSTNKENTEQINKYIFTLFSVLINNKITAELVLKSKELSEDAIWLHYAIPVRKKVKELWVRNLLFMDIYPDQTNLIIVVIDGKETGYKLDYNKQEFKIKV